MQDNDTPEIISNFGSPDARRCGAKTRGGGLCRNLSVRGVLRCRMHGGKSLRACSHPNYKHGCYSKHDLWGAIIRSAYRNAVARRKIERRVAKIIKAERLAREVKEAREAQWRKPHKWNAAQLIKLAGLMKVSEVSQ